MTTCYDFYIYKPMLDHRKFFLFERGIFSYNKMSV